MGRPTYNKGQQELNCEVSTQNRNKYIIRLCSVYSVNFGIALRCYLSEISSVKP